MRHKKLAVFAIAISTFFFSSTGIAHDATIDSQNAEIVKSAHWDSMETIDLLIAEQGEKYFYRPSTLTFKKGQPYKLQITNKGRKKHYFTATKFFKSIATRKVQSEDGEIKAPYFTALEIMPKGGQLDLYFVPKESGNFDFICTIDDHEEKGMFGTIKVE